MNLDELCRTLKNRNSSGCYAIAELHKRENLRIFTSSSTQHTKCFSVFVKKDFTTDLEPTHSDPTIFSPAEMSMVKLSFMVTEYINNFSTPKYEKLAITFIEHLILCI